MITLSLLAASAAMTQAAPVELGRVFTKGESLTYKVRSNLTAESRGLQLRTWMPEDLDINYDFTMDVEEMKTDGIAVIRYKRPTMTIIEGETSEEPAKTNKEKSNFDLRLTLSPINEILDVKDLYKPPVKKKASLRVPNTLAAQGSVIGQFVSEMYRLSLFAGSFDSALDFAPKLRNTKVAVGDTWQKTVGYQPQKMKGKSGKSVVQRLDFTYTYKGPVTVNGKKFQRVEATYDLDTDLSEFINDTFEVKESDTGIKKLPLRMKSKVQFNLDPVTHHCVLAEAETEGGYEVFASDFDNALFETRLKGRTMMQLASRKVAPVKK
ncbi:MAG TPA: hypothetical protein VK934_02030 [Fimbriimonas sp.]|nr:hypothetical protein [Fimbriimonas sp.]